MLRRVDPKRLEVIGDAYRFAHAAIRLSAMFILEDEIGVAKNAFAVKFTDIVAQPTKCSMDPILLSGSLSRGKQPCTACCRCSSICNCGYASDTRCRLPSTNNWRGPQPMPWGHCAPARRVLLWLESGARIAPRDALRQIADETGSAAALAAITEARESGGVPAVGATATLVDEIELPMQLATRTERRAS